MYLQDDLLNQDGIGEKEILVVSFGTSFNDSRIKDIKGIEDAFIEAFPEWNIRRAFTSQMIIDHIKKRDGEEIDHISDALKRAKRNKVKELVIQPTHLMQGQEYDKIIYYVEKYKEDFESVKVAEPLLGTVGEDETICNEDKKEVCCIVVETLLKEAGFLSAEDAAEDGTAFVFLGHGTYHNAKVSYTQVQEQMKKLGFSNVFIGTVEGNPSATACERVLEKVIEAGYKKVIFRPLMVVAGDHANNDMAGEEDSWLSTFKQSKFFTKLDTQIKGLGEIHKIQQIYIEHTKKILENI